MKLADRIAVGVATVGGLGRLPGAPGTWGALPALPLVWLLADRYAALVTTVALVAWVGIAATARAQRLWGTHDDQRVVVDELAGALIATAPAGRSLPLLALGFVLFRWLDIQKPWPIRPIEARTPGALGVMLDDVVAGLLAAAVVALIRAL